MEYGRTACAWVKIDPAFLLFETHDRLEDPIELVVNLFARCRLDLRPAIASVENEE